MKFGWPTLPLGQIAEFEGGSQPPKSEFIYEPRQGYVRFLQIRDFKSDKNVTYIRASSKNRLCSDEDILIGRYGASVGQILTGKAGAYNVALMKAMPDTSVVTRRYFYHYLNSEHFQLRLMSVADRSAQNGFSKEDIAKFPVLVPPIPEQKRIVAILDEAFAGIAAATANAEKNLANARDLFDTYLNSIFDFTPDHWAQRPLNSLVQIKHGFAFKSEYFMDSGSYVLLTPGNFYEEGGYRDRGEKQKFYVGEIPDGFILSKGAFLIAMTEQAPGLLGSSIIVPQGDKFLHNQRLGLVCVRPGAPWCNEFFFHAFNTRRFRQAVHDGASGVKVRHTSPDKLGLVEVSFPKSIEEQQCIAENLDALLVETRRLAGIYNQKLLRLGELKQAILQKAFSGELTSLSENVLREAAE